jgi:hypothetical protein
MKPEGLLPHSQVPAICPYPGPVQSNPYPHIPLPENLSLFSLYQSISPGPRLNLWLFRNMIRFYGEELLTPCPTLKPEDHP